MNAIGIPCTAFDEETHTYTIDGVKVPSVTEICSVLTQSKYQINEAILRQASARGTRVHELCQLMDYDIALLEDEDIDERISGYLRAWFCFERDYSPQWDFIEHMMFHRGLGFAGTADRIGLIDGEPVIVDIKTTSSLDRNSQIALATQIAGYGKLYNKKVNIHKSMGVQLKADGTYKVHMVKDIIDKYQFDAEDLFDSLLHLTKFINYTKNKENK